MTDLAAAIAVPTLVVAGSEDPSLGPGVQAREVVRRIRGARLDGTVGTPDELAAVIAFVASDEARFVNGATVVADGGRLTAR